MQADKNFHHRRLKGWNCNSCSCFLFGSSRSMANVPWLWIIWRFQYAACRVKKATQCWHTTNFENRNNYGNWCSKKTELDIRWIYPGYTVSMIRVICQRCSRSTMAMLTCRRRKRHQRFFNYPRPEQKGSYGIVLYLKLPTQAGTQSTHAHSLAPYLH